MYIRLMNDVEIKLPSELNLEERIALCKQIINNHPMSFTYIMPKNNKDANIVGEQASKRLEILGTYILGAAEKDKECPVMSNYKNKQVSKNEVNISFLENKWDNN